MCQNLTLDSNGNLYSCRRCNMCIHQAINTWTGRGVAEKQTSNFTYVILLTYGSATQEQKDGATVFRYSDIQKFLKLIRIRGERSVPGFTLRYIIAGENGSKKGRVHWHAILYASHDLLTLGDWRSFVTKKTINEKEDKITTDPNQAKRLIWEIWPHGHVTVQIPDAGGIAYVLKYAFKSQFNIVKSKGTARETLAENYSAGMFRMSKKPPIGAAWLQQKLASLAQNNSVLPKLILTTEEFKGHWTPQGKMQDMLVDGLKAINDKFIAENGVNTPQWSSLLASVEINQPAIFERLTRGKEVEDDADRNRETALRGREYDAKRRGQQIRRQCGGVVPCSQCFAGFSADYIKSTIEPATRKAIQRAGGYGLLAANLRAKRTCNPFCQNYESPDTKRAFHTYA